MVIRLKANGVGTSAMPRRILLFNTYHPQLSSYDSEGAHLEFLLDDVSFAYHLATALPGHPFGCSLVGILLETSKYGT